MEEKKIGRPTVLTDEKLCKLKEALCLGMNIKKASEYAGLRPQYVYDCRSIDKDFSEKIEQWRKNLEYRARYTVARAIENGDSKVAMDYLKHTCEDFKQKNTVELSGSNGGPLVFTWQTEKGEKLDGTSDRNTLPTEEDMA